MLCRFLLSLSVAWICFCPDVEAVDIPGGQVFFGDTYLFAGDTVQGSITVVDGSLYNSGGVVEGSVLQIGPGNVIVAGSIDEMDEGFVIVTEGGVVGKNISREGDDFTGVQVWFGAVVYGNVSVTGNGSVLVLFGGTVIGNVQEEGIGFVVVALGSSIEGNIQEQGEGDVFVENLGFAGGNISESGPGSVSVVDGTVDGNIREEDDGDVIIELNSLVTRNVNESGAGAVTIDASSEVLGKVTED